MYIGDLVQSSATEGILGLTMENRNSYGENGGNTIGSWGSDRVTISEEALKLQREAAAAVAVADEEEETQDALAAFKEYMAEAKGETSSSASDVEKLQKKLEQLQSRLQQVASGTLSADTKASMMASIQAQIGAVQAEIAELTAAAQGA